MPEPIVSMDGSADGFSADGQSFSVHEWRGSGPPSLHVHHADDEAWHVLEGSLTFHFGDREVDVGPGASVFVPAGAPHTYSTVDGRYLIILTPRLRALIRELQGARDSDDHAAIYQKYESELLD